MASESNLLNLTVSVMFVLAQSFILFCGFFQLWDVQVDDSLQTIDVIYYLQKNGILLPFEDAVKVMSFVTNDDIRNKTGYEVIHKVHRKFKTTRCFNL